MGKLIKSNKKSHFNRQNILEKINKIVGMIKSTDFIMFLITFTILFGWLMIFYPGNITGDSITQWNQIHGIVPFSDAHPIFHTFIEMILYKIWDSYTCIAIFQIFIFSIIWSYICKITRSENKISKIQLLYTLIITALPIVSIYSITLWKDILYSYSVLSFSICTYIGIKKNFEYTKCDLIIQSIILVFIAQLRHNGLGVAILLIIINLIIFLIKKYSLKKISIFMATIIIMYFITSLPKYTLKLQNPSQNTILSFSTFFLGAYVNEGLVDEQDMKLLKTVFTEKEWKENYYPYCINALTPNANNTKTLVENQEQIVNMAKKYILKYPKILIKHEIKATSLIWKINENVGAYTYILSENSKNPGVGFGLDQKPISEKLTRLATKYVKITMDNNTTIFEILYRPAFSMYMSIILVLLLWYIKKNWKYILIILPMLFNVATLLLILPAQDIRYLYINFLTMIFVIAIFFYELNSILKNKKEV